MSSDEETVGDRIIRAYEQRGMTRAELARAVDVAYHSIWRYEKGKSRPRPAILARIAEATGTTREWLLTGLGPAPDRAPLEMGQIEAFGRRGNDLLRFEPLIEEVESWGKDPDAIDLARVERLVDRLEGMAPLAAARAFREAETDEERRVAAAGLQHLLLLARFGATTKEARWNALGPGRSIPPTDDDVS